MYTGQIVFSQLMDFLPKHEFNQCVRRYQGNYRVRKFSCLDQFLCMVFAQLTYRESLRDTETCLRAVQSKLYHVGIRGRVSRSTLADANETRDWRIWADFAQVLVGRARQLYAGESFGLALQQSAYALDSTTIDLCLSLFPWARFRRRKGGIKVHTLMDLRGSIPCFIRITAANVHDVNILDELLLQPGAFYVMDRAYTDFARLYTFTRSLAFFVVRAKSNLHFCRRAYRHVDKSTGLRSDHTILLQGPKTSQAYPNRFRISPGMTTCPFDDILVVAGSAIVLGSKLYLTCKIVTCAGQPVKCSWRNLSATLWLGGGWLRRRGRTRPHLLSGDF